MKEYKTYKKKKKLTHRRREPNRGMDGNYTR